MIGMGVSIIAASDVRDGPCQVREQPWFSTPASWRKPRTRQGNSFPSCRKLKRLGRVSRYVGPRNRPGPTHGWSHRMKGPVLPHPEMPTVLRLVPLNQVAPGWVHPLLHRYKRNGRQFPDEDTPDNSPLDPDLLSDACPSANRNLPIPGWRRPPLLTLCLTFTSSSASAQHLKILSVPGHP